MKKNNKRVFTKVNTETGQVALYSPDTDKIPIVVQEKILEVLKNENVLSDDMVREQEFLLEQEKAITSLFENWQEIIEFFKTSHIDGQPQFDKQMSDISEAMVPLYNRAKVLLKEWIDLNID
jgi:hypothetical protein